jgi:hypothetical protein
VSLIAWLALHHAAVLVWPLCATGSVRSAPSAVGGFGASAWLWRVVGTANRESSAQ